MKFQILDVFAGQKYQGNQLAVFIADDHLATDEMQRIAREINFSETTFICGLNPQQAAADVRIFSPLTELDFAGHPVIGTALVLKEMLKPVDGEISLLLKVGSVKARFADDCSAQVWIKQPKPVFGETLEKKKAAELLSLPEEAISDDLPVQMVSTGLPHFIIPLNGLDWLKKSRINPEAYNEVIEMTGIKNILPYTEEPYEPEQDIAVRMFAPGIGIPEDPATGSGNGCLAAYLLHNTYKNRDRYKFTVGQGSEIGRPSVLYLEAKRSGAGYDILLGGNAVEIASGNWRL